MMLSSSLSVLFLIMTSVVLQFCWSYPVDFLDSNGRQQRALNRQEAEDLNAELAALTQYLWEKKLTESKRGLDFGLSRGYSGSQTAKQLMGLAAANFANGPGRKRRDVSED